MKPTLGPLGPRSEPTHTVVASPCPTVGAVPGRCTPQHCFPCRPTWTVATSSQTVAEESRHHRHATRALPDDVPAAAAAKVAPEEARDDAR
jgi:hypothetical protein